MIGDFIIITGPMFGGKTEELLRIANRYSIAGKNIVLVTPKKDTRYGVGTVCTHNKQGVQAKTISSIEDIFPIISNSYKKIDAIFIDELQFVENLNIKDIRHITETCGISIYASCLILDSFRNPFSGIDSILPYAEIKYLKAVCDLCGNFEAVYTYRFSNDGEQFMLGGKEQYCALCKGCYFKNPTKEQI